MKRLLIMSAILAGFTTVKAQSAAGMSHNKWEENNTSRHKTTAAPVNQFADMEMSVNDGAIMFSGIPGVKKCVYAVVTNGAGEFIKQMKVSSEQNIMSIKKLRGGLYFVTIVYKNQSKKAFTLNL